MVLHQDRFFDSDPSIRNIARALYDETRELPLICPHGHVEPSLLAENAPFPEPTALLILPAFSLLMIIVNVIVRPMLKRKAPVPA